MADGSSAVSATAVVVTSGPDHAAAVQALQGKYGIQFRLVHLGSSLKSRFGRGENAAVIVSFG
ncbi:hypothetical protein KSP35_11535 [Aquihabitans sp. G128]|nr:hypothetical protein KSP35_11535 [Aquihabitans sp. G128]